jgi:hypothetical protein
MSKHAFRLRRVTTAAEIKRPMRKETGQKSVRVISSVELVEQSS